MPGGPGPCAVDSDEAMRRRGVLLLLLAWAPLGGATERSGDWIRRRLRLVYTFRNPSDRPVSGARFWCYLPAHLEDQALLDVQVSVPHRIVDDAWGHRVLALEFERRPPYSSAVVALTAEVALHRDPRSHVPDGAGSWRRPQRHVEVDDPAVQALAATLRGADDLQTARAIYDWVHRHLTYTGYVAEDLGAAQALRHRRGDCTEYAALTVALARANGLPARLIGGYVVDGDSAPRPEDYHNWAQLYVDGAWQVVDAQRRCFSAGAGRYVAFEIYRDDPTNPIGAAHRYRMQGGLTVGFS